MGWRTVVVTKHAKISYKLEHVIVQTDNDIVQVPIADVQILMIATTQAVITTHLMMELSRNDIKVIFTDNKEMPVGEFTSYYSNLSRNRNISKQIIWDSDRKSLLWQNIIKMKITNEAKMLEKFQRTKYDGSPGHQDLLDLLDEVKPGDSTNREAVAARMYFQRLYDTKFNRRKDEFVANGHLNFGYSVLLSLITQEICCAGYLTELGIHHDSMENFYNLSSDLIEPFRVFVDEIAFNKYENPSFDLADKLELVNLLNQTVTTNSGDALLSGVIKTFVRKCLKYLSNETDVLPEIEIKI
ncbi:type II CRISPR-associated endonuclease Cas1 [Xylocopilactobacillus apicola]|uniref:CRISPR-associated endonuclease Cas1 n=1 Tax=Xylocopilactobacillus apicola TaxID=2932184 RepID=A0AAU9DWA8_9LACO|nr:type II CRISPR-associated endonuclease Cas1 [Xylocopilactobacillus apicola]BDR58248.1 CRISPR-associated endonuclease Cas1 [Xylocopilactobacillus apicola]